MNPRNEFDHSKKVHFSPVVLENLALDDPTDGSNKRYHWPPARPTDPEWNLGWTDGRLGHPIGLIREQVAAGVRIGLAEKTDAVGHAIAVKKGRLAGAKSLRDSFAMRLSYARQEYDETRGYCLRHASQIGIVLGLLFLIFAGGLVIADLPLSLTLVAEGFRIPTSQTFLDGSGNPVVVDIDQLFVAPKLVCQYLWQCLVLALGIALAPMYLKVLLDSLVFRDSESQKPQRREVIALGVIATLLIAMVGILGHFRAMSHQSNLFSEAQMRATAMTQALKNFGAASQPVPAPSPSGLGDTPLSPWLTDTAFILLTLTLPLIGAVFFSRGWQRVAVCVKRNRSELALSYLEWRHRRLLARSVRFEEELAVEENKLLPYLQSKEYERLLVEDRMRAYHHGWERGNRVSVTLRHGEGLYERCKALLLRRVADRQR